MLAFEKYNIPVEGSELESLADKELVPWATKHTEARYKDSEKHLEETYRTRFRRDRDRILYSEAFRRLQNKTQVVGTEVGDDFRTRLTHSLEVEQIAVSLADALKLNKDLVSAIALGHDLGHPPFGHAVESLLNEKLNKEFNEGFSHAVQSVRYLEDQAKGRKGLNISLQVLEGILKHDTDIFDGTYDNIYKKQHDCDHLKSCIPGSMESQVVYWADKIAYLSHDFEDFRKTKILDEALEKETLKEEELKKVLSNIITEDNEKIDKLKTSINDGNTDGEILENPFLESTNKDNSKIDNVREIETRDIIRNVIANLIKGTVDNIKKNRDNLESSKDVADLTNYRMKKQEKNIRKEKEIIKEKKILEEKEKKVKKVEDKERNSKEKTEVEKLKKKIKKDKEKLEKKIKKKAYQNALIVNFSDKYRETYLELREIINKHYISSPQISRSDRKAERIVDLIYDEFVNDQRMLPLEIQKYIDDERDAKHRAIADYIASMTDRQAKNIYKKLFEVGDYGEY